jgi:hypothetical protein
MTLALSLFVHGEAVRFNRGKSKSGDYDFKYMRGSDGNIYPYVSSQCYKRFWRETLPESPSPVTRGKNKKGIEINQVYTDGNPIKYVDDDLFGYMIAGAEEENEKDEQEDIILPDDLDSGEEDESLFDTESLAEANKFIGVLRDSDNPFSKFIQSQFSSQIKSKLDSHNTSEQLGDELKQMLADELNKILMTDLYRQPNFKEKISKNLTKEFGPEPTGKNLTKLNRLLLERVFKDLSKKNKKRDTTKRTAPIRMHALVAFSGIKMAQDFQTFSRDVPLTGKDSVLNPNPVGIYSGWLKTRILIEEHRIGKFYIGKNKDILASQLEQNIVPQVEKNPYSSNPSEKVQYYELMPGEIKRRFNMAITALADIGNKNGPASGALHDGSLKPKIFIGAFMRCADSPFDDVWIEKEDGIPKINVKWLQNAINDWKGLFAKREIYIALPIQTDNSEKENLKMAIEELQFESGKNFIAVISTPRQTLLKLAEDVIG